MNTILINPTLLSKFEGATMLSLTVDEANNLMSLASLGNDLMTRGELTLSLIPNGVGSLSAVEAPQPYKSEPEAKIDGLAMRGAPQVGKWYDTDYNDKAFVKRVEPRDEDNDYQGMVYVAYADTRSSSYDFKEFAEAYVLSEDDDSPEPADTDAPNEYILQEDDYTEIVGDGVTYKVGDTVTRVSDGKEFVLMRFGYAARSRLIYVGSRAEPREYVTILCTKKDLKEWRFGATIKNTIAVPIPAPASNVKPDGEEWTPQEWDSKQGRPTKGNAYRAYVKLAKVGDKLMREKDGKAFTIVRLVEVGTKEGDYPIAYLVADDGTERHKKQLSGVLLDRWWRTVPQAAASAQ